MGILDKVEKWGTIGIVLVGGYVLWKNWGNIVRGFCSIPLMDVAFPEACAGSGSGGGGSGGTPDCISGYHKNNQDICVPDDCAPGYYRNLDGNCVQEEQVCPEGTLPVGVDNTCVPILVPDQHEQCHVHCWNFVGSERAACDAACNAQGGDDQEPPVEPEPPIIPVDPNEVTNCTDFRKQGDTPLLRELEWQCRIDQGQVPTDAACDWFKQFNANFFNRLVNIGFCQKQAPRIVDCSCGKVDLNNPPGLTCEEACSDFPLDRPTCDVEAWRSCGLQYQMSAGGSIGGSEEGCHASGGFYYAPTMSCVNSAGLQLRQCLCDTGCYSEAECAKEFV